MADPIGDLTTNLRFHRTWLIVCREYLSTHPTLPFDRFLRRMLKVEQDGIEALAQALRQAGHGTARIGVNDDMVTEARRRRTQSTRMQYIKIGLDRSLLWYQTHMDAPDDPHHELWQSLHHSQAGLLAEINDLLGIVPTA